MKLQNQMMSSMPSWDEEGVVKKQPEVEILLFIIEFSVRPAICRNHFSEKQSHNNMPLNSVLDIRIT
jgi:hypothetical protein